MSDKQIPIVDVAEATFFGAHTHELSRQIKDGEIIITEVRVLQLPPRKFPELAKAIDSETELIGLYTTLTPSQVDALAHEDYIAILEAGGRLNQDFFTAWLGRNVERAKELIAILQAKILMSNGTSSLPSL